MIAIATPKLSSADVESAWNKIRTLADSFVERSGRENGFSIEPGSPLHGDDTAVVFRTGLPRWW